MGIFDGILILSDFDGTFAGEGGRIIDRNISAIEYFRANGGHFSFSTGRLPSVMSRIFPDFRTVSNAPLIMCNGALVYEPSEGKILRESWFDGVSGRKMADDVLSRFPSMSLAVYPDDMEYHGKIKPEDVPGDRWHKARFDRDDDPQLVSDCRDYLLRNYGDSYNIFRSWYNVVEIVDKSSAKGKCIDFIKKYLKNGGCGEMTAFCIGDYENDIDMLKRADYAFCPSNAIDEVKALCQPPLCHHDRGAVADLIETIRNSYI